METAIPDSPLNQDSHQRCEHYLTTSDKFDRHSNGINRHLTALPPISQTALKPTQTKLHISNFIKDLAQTFQFLQLGTVSEVTSRIMLGRFRLAGVTPKPSP
ncbi:hypothetical protein KC19_2G146000 [Ceratodon purpureus]|uniref:Uncharacterized protein n=1 Tax=Ceratodon purpureus TaxID=3225 RepID=A0A8T0ITY6_CERPU|nr:hypothetical protein KC19_2G146000 [Ceratodon purpureus]